MYNTFYFSVETSIIKQIKMPILATILIRHLITIVANIYYWSPPPQLFFCVCINVDNFGWPHTPLRPPCGTPCLVTVHIQLINTMSLRFQWGTHILLNTPFIESYTRGINHYQLDVKIVWGYNRMLFMQS